jgi:periplasmic protein TonB
MKTDAILKADVLDIIFENRNKSYGAYALRKFYNNRLYKALGVMVGFVIILCVLSFTIKAKKDLLPIENLTVTEFSAPPKDAKQPEKPKEFKEPIQAAARIPVRSVIFTTPVITTKINVPSVTTLDPSTQISNVQNLTGTGEPKVLVKPTNGVDSFSTPEPPKKPIDQVTPTDIAEVMPTYPGGMEALRNFLQKNLQNPEDIEEGQTVAVKIKFVVGYDGTLKSFETVEDGGSAFNNEVIRVLKKMKPWNPGKTRGENVSVYYTIPVKFTTSQ